MLRAETIGRIRRIHFEGGHSIKRISRNFQASRETVRQVVRSEATLFGYVRKTQPHPKMRVVDPDANRIASGFTR